MLSAGERRSEHRDTILSATRRGASRIRRARCGSARRREPLGLGDGVLAAAVTSARAPQVPVEVNEMMQQGNMSLPNGLGLADGPGGSGDRRSAERTDQRRRRDWLAGTPWHKHVPARIEPLRSGPYAPEQCEARSAT